MSLFGLQVENNIILETLDQSQMAGMKRARGDGREFGLKVRQPPSQPMGLHANTWK